jgi:competence protein ComFA
MKAVLYAVKRGTSWLPFLSVAWEVDVSFWRGNAMSLARVSEMLPLGLAEAACNRLREQWSEESGSKDRDKGRGNPGNGKLAEWMEDIKRAVLWACGDDEYSIYSSLNVEEVDVCWVQNEGPRVEGDRFAEAAQLAGKQLAGRSLLQEEAAQLLSDVLPAELSADYLAALQLAALTGALQLTAAIAPRPAASPQRGLRAWAERLRPARLLGLAAAQRRPAALTLYCRRCGSGHDKLRRTPCAACGQACAYCEACLTMGRSRECGLLVIGAPSGSGAFSLAPSLSATASSAHSSESAVASPTPESLALRWGLSPAQSAASTEALNFLSRPQSNQSSQSQYSKTFLLWAVTGAGKTEMIFPLLEAVLSRGGRALVATPRRDVVLELAPRLAKAFPQYTRTVLYGGSEDRWENGALTLATTHQLLRFQEAFDLVLIDELDAFPFHNDPTLHFAASKCCKKTGSTVYLSATPPPLLQRAAARRRLACARVPVRYHRKPLPVPKRMTIPALTQIVRRGKLPHRLIKPLQHSINRSAQIFLFVPYVRQVEPLVQLLRRHSSLLNIKPNTIEGTSSKDAERNDKVTAFRNHTIQLLVSTTILERGVTIPRSDVFILDASNPMFDAASLVQMAGRAGRSADDPFGLVYFAAPEWTFSQRSSTHQIRNMNHLASRKGYFI